VLAALGALNRSPEACPGSTLFDNWGVASRALARLAPRDVMEDLGDHLRLGNLRTTGGFFQQCHSGQKTSRSRYDANGWSQF